MSWPLTLRTPTLQRMRRTRRMRMLVPMLWMTLAALVLRRVCLHLHSVRFLDLFVLAISVLCCAAETLALLRKPDV